jgi:hypothetical protein
LAKSFTDVTVAGLLGGTATSAVFLAKSTGLAASPAVTTVSMFFGAAEANTSAGAPSVIWVARVELAPKLNFTVSPGWAVSNCFPSWVKVPISDAAANTVIVPVCVAELVLAADEDELAGLEELLLEELLLEQPATATAASATTVRAKRRMLTPWLHLRGRDQLVPGNSTETLAATKPPGLFRRR